MFPNLLQYSFSLDAEGFTDLTSSSCPFSHADQGRSPVEGLTGYQYVRTLTKDLLTTFMDVL